MSRPAISIYVLLALLLGTNAMWLHRLNADASVASKPIAIQCNRTEETVEVYDTIVRPLTDAIAAAAKPGASKESIIRAANAAGFGTNLICMGDASVIRVRGVGLRFSENGQLTGATAAHCPP